MQLDSEAEAVAAARSERPRQQRVLNFGRGAPPSPGYGRLRHDLVHISVSVEVERFRRGHSQCVSDRFHRPTGMLAGSDLHRLRIRPHRARLRPHELALHCRRRRVAAAKREPGDRVPRIRRRLRYRPQCCGWACTIDASSASERRDERADLGLRMAFPMTATCPGQRQDNAAGWSSTETRCGCRAGVSRPRLVAFDVAALFGAVPRTYDFPTVNTSTDGTPSPRRRPFITTALPPVDGVLLAAQLGADETERHRNHGREDQ